MLKKLLNKLNDDRFEPVNDPHADWIVIGAILVMLAIVWAPVWLPPVLEIV